MLRLLGTVEAGPDADNLHAVSAPRLRAILAVLGAFPGERVSVGRLTDALWPDEPPRSAEASIQVHVGKIRRLFEPTLEARADSTFVRYEPGAYVLDLPRSMLDVTAFLDAAKGEPGWPSAKMLWADPPFVEFESEPWAVGMVTELRRARLSAIQSHFAALGDDRLTHELLDELVGHVEQHPFDETLAMQLMKAQYHSGDQRAALATARRLRDTLRHELGLDSTPAVAVLEQKILHHELEVSTDLSPARTTTSRSGPTPRRSPMFGRESELDRLRTASESHQLVTITGPGGVGKSRLAQALVDQIPGALFIDLSTSVTRAHVIERISTAVRADGDPLATRIDALAATLAADASLVVLDNCEQLDDEFPTLVDELLRAAHTLRIVATSQRSIGIVHEVGLRLAPFAPPSPDTSCVDTDPGIRLLCEHADIDATPENAAALITLHNQLDGMPLALQLASIRLRSMSIDDVIALRDVTFDEPPVGLPHRQRSPDGLVAASIEALSAYQQEVLDACSIFAGPVPLDAILRLMKDKADSVETRIAVSHLVDRSLMSMTTDEPIRYQQLDSIRRHCRARLTTSGRLGELERRHTRLVRDLATDSIFAKSGIQPIHSMHDEAVAALDRLEANPGDSGEALNLVTVVATSWYGTGRVAEGCARLHSTLRLHGDGPAFAVGTTSALLGMMSFDVGAFNNLATYTKQALAQLEPLGAPGLAFIRAGHHVGRGELVAARESIAAALNDPMAVGRQLLAAYEVAATVEWMRGDHERAAHFFAQQHAAAADSNDHWFTAHARRGEAMMRAALGDHMAALAMCRDADSIPGSERPLRTISEQHAATAVIRFSMGDIDTARSASRTVLEASVHRFDAHSVGNVVPIAAACALEDGDAASVARLSGWFEGVAATTGFYAPMAAQELLAATAAHAERNTDAATWATARADGPALGLAHALGCLVEAPGGASDERGAPHIK